MTKKARLYSSGDTNRCEAIPDRPTIGPESYRTAFRRDYARLIHSPAFRRLQGKTQVFPGVESDFFRNRLTHSLEVAQIAKSIALRFNDEHQYFRHNPIDTDLIEFAGLAHDLGHPPFGHNGEKALDQCMLKAGGFEGNAQTFRILSRLEKKGLLGGAETAIEENGRDNRIGLNLAFRSLAAILKYDRLIPQYRDDGAKVIKGIFDSEKEVYLKVKSSVCEQHAHNGKFKTIECGIMDIADDIAYSTYDLEDTFKAGFLTPLDLIKSVSNDTKLRRALAVQVSESTGSIVTEHDVVRTVVATFEGLFGSTSPKKTQKTTSQDQLYLTVEAYAGSGELAANGYVRTRFTAELVSEFLAGVQLRANLQHPSMSKVSLKPETLRKVEILKRLTYELTIMSPRLRVSEQRGYDIVGSIFEKLTAKGGYYLLPGDFREAYERTNDDSRRRRIVCDFIAGMTDRYAVEFYGRIFSVDPQSIFKPL